MEEIKSPLAFAVCKNVEHWSEMILFGKCKNCGGEILITKSDIPRLARDIEHLEMEADIQRPQTQSEAYRYAH